MKTQSMYREEIMDIYLEKPNFGKLKNKTHFAKVKISGCQDEFTLELNIKDKKIIDAKFHGKGCVISTISASLLTEKVKGMKIKNVLKIDKNEMDKLIKIEVIPTRINCELLALEAIKKAIK